MWHGFREWVASVVTHLGTLRSRMPSLRGPRPWVWKVLGGVGVLALLLAALWGPVSLANPSLCRSCHVPAKAYTDWRDSPHAEVSCGDCHTDRASLAGLGNTIATADTVLGGSARGPRVPDSACISCHPGLENEEPVVIDGVFRMSHTGLSEAGYRCVECHVEAAHTVSEARVGRATMSVCAKCHNNVKESGACETCHVGKKSVNVARRVDVEWSKTHGKNWERTHGMGDLATCTLCHEREKCQACHDIPLPHEKNFLAVHGELAVQSTEPCLSCHKGALCDSCHGMEMPHPADFLQTHSLHAVDDQDPRCKTCHPLDSCVRCHERHVHPGGAGS